MGLFFDVLSSINNPSQQGNVSQLESVASSIQKLASTRGMDDSKTQSLLSAMGGFLQPALQQQQQTMGAGSLGSLVGQLGAGAPGASALTALLPPQMQQQMVQNIAQKTGLSPNMLQSALPVLVPAVMGLLHMGASKPGTNGGNPLLGAFLDSSQGNTDLGDAFKFATRFLGSGR